MSYYSDLKKLGWMSSYTRQVLLVRFLLRIAKAHMGGRVILHDNLLLSCFRLAISVEVGRRQKTSLGIFAPYEPSDQPTTYFLKQKRRGGVEVKLATELSEPDPRDRGLEKPHVLIAVAENWSETTLEHLDSISNAFLALAQELNTVSKGINLMNKRIADQRCDELIDQPLWPPAVQTETLDELANANPEFSFWTRFLKARGDGHQFPSELVDQVAMIPDEVWDTSAEAVAGEIAKIEADFWEERLPQNETLSKDPETGKYNVAAATYDDTSEIERWLSQIEFALNLAVDSNHSDFNRMCTAFKYLNHALENCRDDPNAIEQQVGIARGIIDANLSKPDYASDDNLEALSKVLEQIQVQMRADHPDVRKAWEKRIAQKLREVDRDTKLAAAEAIRTETERTAGRLSDEMELDAEAVETSDSVEAQAIAIRRAGGRSAKMNVMDRASDTVKKVDSSAGYKAIRIAGTGRTIGEIIGMLTGLF